MSFNENGMTAQDLPDPLNQSPGSEHHQAVRTKVIGSAASDFQHSDYARTAARIARQESQAKSEHRQQQARRENIDRAAEMRHLRYEVIQDADIVQISVINSEDGTIIRKIPPDKTVGFARKLKEKKDSRKRRLDITA
ncbi:MAG: flagellar protein FlaG [Synergistaceae bacterium]|nr:flagellar protein FlaG [Synergistaceae bacterium]